MAERSDSNNPDTHRSARHRVPTPAAEVARQAGVSLMTVSRVFNDSPLVAKKTRARVQEIARLLGYQPNMAARVLRTGRAETLGYVLSSANALRGEFHTESLVAFESVVSSRRLSVTLSAPSGSESLIDRVNRLVASSRSGALVVQFDILTNEDTELLALVDAPVVLANHPGGESALRLGLNTVGFDNADGVAQAVRHLVSLRHTRIAYLGGTPEWMDSEGRERGFRQAAKELKVEMQDHWFKTCDFASGYATGAHAMGEIFGSAGPQPTAVVCASDEIATGVLAAARQWGKTVPGDLSVVGFDDINWARFNVPSLTTVRHSGWELGERMGEVILELFDKPDLPAKQILLKTHLIARESTARL